MQIKTTKDKRVPVQPKNLAEWEGIKKELYETIRFSSSVELLKHDAPLNPSVTLAAEYEDFVIENVILQTLPGFYLAGNIYRPKDTSKKYPVILNPHGHWPNGRIDQSELAELPKRYANFAMRGMVVFAYDMLGYNDTNQIEHRVFKEEYELYNYGRFSLQLNNSRKALDFVCALPYADTEKIGCTGASGGGTQTFFLTAFDERIRAAAPINMVSAIMQGGCICENTAFLRTEYCNVDYAMMAAPRHLFIASSDGDWTVHSRELEFPAIQSLYALYGAEDKFTPYYRSAPHCYEKCTREEVYTFFCKAFGVTDAFDGEVDIDIDVAPLTVGGIPAFENKIQSEEELFAVAKKIIETNIAALDADAKKEICKRVFVLDTTLDFDIPYLKEYSVEKECVMLGNCPENVQTLDAKYYHTYNYAEDTKRVNGLVKLFEKYPDAEYHASGKTAALCRIAEEITGKRNLILSDPDENNIHIPGYALYKLSK